MASPLDPTEQQLRDACARMAQRFGWTDGFDVVMQDARRGRLVRLAVAHPSAADLATAHASRSRARPTFQPPPAGVPFLDRKRAASGERDDD
ncbi:hypothetical protein [Variovorax sp. CY25R-8]|uniref:hypothetical protein n=1 Tax=Variovorax sp. CY25R-8 TaxID=2855501 RepID=UPI0021BA9CAE|nr:hypothetical protein [Variovorax sp. CY25R-8]MCT8178104.1 hypothetical protein [Variovorax sp. CY25R-8]